MYKKYIKNNIGPLKYNVVAEPLIMSVDLCWGHRAVVLPADFSSASWPTKAGAAPVRVVEINPILKE